MTKRLAGLVAGIAGVAALVSGLFSNEWVVGEDAGIESHVGLHSTVLCQVVQPDLSEPGVRTCTSVSHGEIANSPSAIDGFDTFSLVSRITFWTGLACAAVLVVLLVFGALGRYPDLPLAPSTVGIVLSFGTLVLIALTLAIHPWKSVGWGTGSAILLAGSGAVACLFASIMLGRLKPAIAEDW